MGEVGYARSIHLGLLWIRIHSADTLRRSLVTPAACKSPSEGGSR